MTLNGPKGRAKRPNRRDHGGLTTHADAVPWHSGVTDILVRFGFPHTAVDDVIFEIHDALCFREHRPLGVLREADEKEDLAELRVRLEDVLDSLHAMANKTRCRILDATKAAGSELDPLDVERMVRWLQWGVVAATAQFSSNADRGGRPPYDDSRETPWLATLVAIWFAQFTDDLGVKRRGDYAEAGCAEYEGRLLDFIFEVFKAVGVDGGSTAAIGKRVFGLQDRIRQNLEKRPA